MREIVNAMYYVLRGGGNWRMLPHDLPPWSTLYTYYRQWRRMGLWEAHKGRFFTKRKKRSRISSCSYRDLKSDGWQWHHTRLRNPERAERHWLAMSVALIWMLTLGAEPPITSETEGQGESSRNTTHSTRSRLSCFLKRTSSTSCRLSNSKSK